MLNLFTKKKPWLVASLLTATVAFAQDNNHAKCRPQKGFDQGHEMMQNQMMPAYNAPARVEVRGSWDVYATGSFIYWQARQDNMELGYVSNYSTPFNPALRSGVASINNLVLSDFTYKPGFKFGLGVNLDWDNWDAYAEYTWFHGTTTTGVSPLVTSPAAAVPGEPNYLFPTQQQAAYDSVGYFNSANQIWNLKMDLLDISLARSSYSGMKLSVRPFFGARGAWIRQSLENSYNSNLQDPTSSTGRNLTGTTSYTSWGVGPRAGFESNWMMGYGFRFIGNGSADILYTRYDLRSLSNLQNLLVIPSTSVQSGNFYADHLDLLRSHTDLELGFGWGSYFDNNNWHVDLSATYGYQVFWDQNMFMFVANPVVYSPSGNLYVHGLNLTARLDF